MKKLNNLKYAMLLVLTMFLVGCPPTVTILSPSNCAHFGIGEEITFSGSGIDLQEGELMESSLAWTSSIDGQIGTGTTFTRNDLSEGFHEITLTANNSNAETGTAKISIIIGDPEEGANDCDDDHDDDHDDGGTTTTTIHDDDDDDHDDDGDHEN